MRCVQSKFALAFGSMARASGPRGSRSPCPEWRVTEANRRLAQHGLTKKRLAKALAAHGISEMMVLRCLHEDPRRRVPTIEAITHISRALGIPMPVFVARSMEESRAIEAAVAFSELDAKTLAIATDVSDDGRDGDTDEEQGAAVQHRNTATMDGRRPRAPAARPQAVRRAPRSR
jgi:hypothetical protein